VFGTACAPVWSDSWQSYGVPDNSAVAYLTVPDLAERFSSTPGKIRGLLRDQYIAAIRVDGVLSIPVEFVRETETLDGLRGSLIQLGDAGLNNEQAVAWLLAENDELGCRPIDSLIAGHKAQVRRAAQSLAF
jgi:hypothetical protein